MVRIRANIKAIEIINHFFHTSFPVKPVVVSTEENKFVSELEAGNDFSEKHLKVLLILVKSEILN